MKSPNGVNRYAAKGVKNNTEYQQNAKKILIGDKKIQIDKQNGPPLYYPYLFSGKRAF